MSSMKELYLLVVDDDYDDFKIISEAFGEYKFPPKLHHLLDGRQLLEYLDSAIREATGLPDLILLDINMPRMDGIEALKNLKNNPSLKDIPVLIYTTTSNPDQMRCCYLLGANGFVTKGASFKTVMRFAGDLLAYIPECRRGVGIKFREPGNAVLSGD